jgi:uncharacterized damage-inducible protein DinB
MKNLLQKQLQFEHWANTEMLREMQQANPLHHRALVLYSHILSASTMWLSRLKYEPMTTTLFAERTLAECEVLNAILYADWTKYFETAEPQEFEKIIDFISPVDNLKRRISVSDAIMHVVHHSSYHRGQIIVLLKGTIPALPLITYMPFASTKL